MKRDKIVRQLFIGKVADRIGMEDVMKLWEEAEESVPHEEMPIAVEEEPEDQGPQ